MNFQWQERARKDYQDLPSAVQRKMEKALRLFARNPWHPSLHTEKIDFRRDIWSSRVDRNYRFTFQWIPGGMFLRRVGAHQETYRSP